MAKELGHGYVSLLGEVQGLVSDIEKTVSKPYKVNLNVDGTKLRGDIEKALAGAGVKVDAEIDKSKLAAMRQEIGRDVRANVIYEADTSSALRARAELERPVRVRVERNEFDRLTGQINKATSSVTSFAAQGIKVAAVTSAVGGLVAALSGVVGAAGAAGAALAGMLAPAIVGMQGMGDAFTAMSALEKDGAQSGIDMQKQHEAALDRVRDAQQGQRTALNAVGDAQRDVNNAYRDAGRLIEDVTDKLRSSQLDTMDADLAVAESQQRLLETMYDPRATALQRRRSQLDVLRSLDRQHLAQTREFRQGMDTADTINDGISGNKDLVGAQRAQQDALFNLTKAQTELTRAVRDQNSAIATGSTTMDNYNQALRNLSPNARAFMEAMRGMSGEHRKFKDSVQDSLFAGLDQAVPTFLRANLQRIGVEFSLLAGYLNSGFKGTLDSLTGTFDKLGANGAMGRFNVMIKSITDQFGLMASTGTEGMVNWGGAIGDSFGTLIKSIGAELPALGTSFGTIGKTFNESFAQMMPSLSKFIQAINKDFGPLIPIITNGLGILFDKITPALPDISKAFGVFLQDGLFKSLDMLADALVKMGPDLPKVASAMADSLTSVAGIVSTIAPVLASMSSVLPTLLTALLGLRVLTAGARFVNQTSDAVGNLRRGGATVVEGASRAAGATRRGIGAGLAAGAIALGVGGSPVANAAPTTSVVQSAPERAVAPTSLRGATIVPPPVSPASTAAMAPVVAAAAAPAVTKAATDAVKSPSKLAALAGGAGGVGKAFALGGAGIAASLGVSTLLAPDAQAATPGQPGYKKPAWYQSDTAQAVLSTGAMVAAPAALSAVGSGAKAAATSAAPVIAEGAKAAATKVAELGTAMAGLATKDNFAKIGTSVTKFGGLIASLPKSLGLVTVAQTALNLAMDANPIGLIVVGIAALAAGLIYAYTHSETFRKIVDGALKAVGMAFTWMWEQAKSVFEWLKGGWNDMMGFFKGIPEKVTGFFSGMWDGIKESFKGVINWLIDKWNGFAEALSFTTPSWLPGDLGGKKWSLPTLQRFADGGQINRDNNVIRGPGDGRSDSIVAQIMGSNSLIRVANGEGIVTEQAMGNGGSAIMSLLNSAGGVGTGFLSGLLSAFGLSLPKFADGGALQEGLNPGANSLRNFIFQQWPSIKTIGGRRSEDGFGEHSSGNAIDVMIPSWSTPEGKATGDAIAAFLRTNKDAIGVNGFIWQQASYGYGGSFDKGNPMSDRGSPTQNHMDHVHVILGAGRGVNAAPVGLPTSSVTLPPGSNFAGGSGGGTGGGYSGGGSGASSGVGGSPLGGGLGAGDIAGADQRYQDAMREKTELVQKGNATQEQLTAADKKVADAQENLTKVKDAASKPLGSQALMDQLGGVPGGSAGGASGGWGSQVGSELGSSLAGGAMNFLGLDGSIFQNLLQTPNFKSLMAGVNFFGGLAVSKLGGGQGGGLGLNGVPGAMGLPDPSATATVGAYGKSNFGLPAGGLSQDDLGLPQSPGDSPLSGMISGVADAATSQAPSQQNNTSNATTNNNSNDMNIGTINVNGNERGVRDQLQMAQTRRESTQSPTMQMSTQ